jgi:protein involved in polysaccharide export with SLBB domain
LEVRPALVPEPAPVSVKPAMMRPGLILNVAVVVAGKKQIEEAGRRISETGTLTLPLVGTLAVEELTLDGLRRILTAGYREFFVDPLVMVELVREERAEGVSPWGYVTVLGRVKRPGRVSIPPTRDLTLSMAIQQAGGFDTSAKDTGILVTRRDPDGKTTTDEVNLRAVGSRGKVENDVVLSPDDVVYVPVLYF